jgi:hypothetical protein
MERVAFLVEETGQRVGCLLNPETVVIERLAGVRPRRSMGGPLTGQGLPDDALLFTGGGVTRLKLDLLFDVSLGGSTVQTEDVRDLTGPLWNLAENQDRRARPPRVRFVWGKSWNIPAVVEAVAERLEYFTPEGAPRRSWLRMRLLRSVDPEESVGEAAESPRPPVELSPDASVPEDEVRVESILGGRTPEHSSERLDGLAQKYYGDPGLWRLLAEFNHLDDPMKPPREGLLRIPPPSAGRST